jgi:hypothetical protein
MPVRPACEGPDVTPKRTIHPHWSGFPPFPAVLARQDCNTRLELGVGFSFSHEFFVKLHLQASA